MQTPFATLSDALDSCAFARLTLFRTDAGYQVSVSDDGISWHVKIASTPSAALAECLDWSPPAPITLAPPPY